MVVVGFEISNGSEWIGNAESYCFHYLLLILLRKGEMIFVEMEWNGGNGVIQ
jgi:hypothetical protein